MKRGKIFLFILVCLFVLVVIGVVSAENCIAFKKDLSGGKITITIPCNGKINIHPYCLANPTPIRTNTKVYGWTESCASESGSCGGKLMQCGNLDDDDCVCCPNSRCQARKICNSDQAWTSDPGGYICNRFGQLLNAYDIPSKNEVIQLCPTQEIYNNNVYVKSGDRISFWVQELINCGDASGINNYIDFTPLPACSDSFDNDNDGKIDYCLADKSNAATCDPGCSSADDTDETDSPGCTNDLDCNDNNPDTEDKCNNPGTDSCTHTLITNNCPPNQTIIKLSSHTNAHGAIWNDSSGAYNWNVCYNQTFGKEYIGTVYHNCSGTNSVVNLSAITNAHASVLNDYGTNVCFGDLICRNTTSTCSSDEKSIIRLSANTNAHLSNASNTNYPVNICCKNVEMINGNAYWQNLKGDIITIADKEDSVKMILNREGVSNKNINYSVYKRCEGLGCVAAFIFGNKKVAQFSSIGFSTWKANDSGKFYFTAKVEGATEVYTSSDLEVKTSINNAKPLIKIIKPIENSTFIIGISNVSGNIYYEQNSSDEDDDLNITWDFADKTSLSLFNCLTGNNCNTTHFYRLPGGTKIIKATAVEETRDQSEYDLSRIYIYKQGLTLFTIIDKPYYKTREFSSDPIQVDARSSYVANCSFSKTACQAAATSISKTCYDITDSNDNCVKADINKDGKIDLSDLKNFTNDYSANCRNTGIYQIIREIINNKINEIGMVPCNESNQLCELLDMNNDGDITSLDSLYLDVNGLNCQGKISSTTLVSGSERSDLNKDGFIDTIDRNLLLNLLNSYALGTDCNNFKIYCYKYAESSNPSETRFIFNWTIDGVNKPEYPNNSAPFYIIFPEGGRHNVNLNVKFNNKILTAGGVGEAVRV